MQRQVAVDSRARRGRRRSAPPGRRRRPTAARGRSGGSSRAGPRHPGRRRGAGRWRRSGPPCRPSGRSPRARAARSPRRDRRSRRAACRSRSAGRSARADGSSGGRRTRARGAGRSSRRSRSRRRRAPSSAAPRVPRRSRCRRRSKPSERLADLVVEPAVHRRPRLGEHRGDRLATAPAGRGADQHPAVDQRRAGLVAVELDRLRQPEVLGDEPADRVVDELRVACRLIAVCYVSRIATTPWPPAAQIEISPRPPPRSLSSFARLPTIRPPVAAKGWPAASEPPLDVELVAVDRAERLVEAEPLLAEDRVLPGGERAEHLRRERLVDLVEVEVLKLQARCGRAFAAPRRRAPSAGPPAADVVDRGGLGVDEAGQRGRARARSPHSSVPSSTAEAPSLSGVELPAVIVPSSPPKTGFSFASFSTVESGRRFWSRSSPRYGVTRSSSKPLVVGGGEVLVAGRRELVLGIAGDAPLAGHDRRVLAHREAGPRLGVAGDLGDELPGPQPASSARSRSTFERAALSSRQDRAEVVVDRDRRVRGGVDAAGDAAVDLAEGDLVGDEDRRLETGAAGLADVVGRRLGREPRAEQRLAGQVEVAGVLEDGATGDLAEPLAGDAVALERGRRERRSACPGSRRARRARLSARTESGSPPRDDRGLPGFASHAAAAT